MPNSARVPDDWQPWPRRIAWALLSAAAVLFAASAFLAFDAARGVAHAFSHELILAGGFGLVLPLAIFASIRRLTVWSGPPMTLFATTAFAVAALFFILAGLVGWLG